MERVRMCECSSERKGERKVDSIERERGEKNKRWTLCEISDLFLDYFLS